MDIDRCIQFVIEYDAHMFPLAISSIEEVLMSIRHIAASLGPYQFVQAVMQCHLSFRGLNLNY